MTLAYLSEPPSWYIHILERHHLCPRVEQPLAHAPQLQPFSRISHLAVAIVYTLCKCLSTVFKPPSAGIRDSRTVVATPVYGNSGYKAESHRQNFLGPSSEHSHCSQAHHLSAHQNLTGYNAVEHSKPQLGWQRFPYEWRLKPVQAISGFTGIRPA